MEIDKNGIALVLALSLLFSIGRGECKQLSSNHQTKRIYDSKLDFINLAKSIINGFKELTNEPYKSKHHENKVYKIVDASTRPLYIFV